MDSMLNPYQSPTTPPVRKNRQILARVALYGIAAFWVLAFAALIAYRMRSGNQTLVEVLLEWLL